MAAPAAKSNAQEINIGFLEKEKEISGLASITIRIMPNVAIANPITTPQKLLTFLDILRLRNL